MGLTKAFLSALPLFFLLALGVERSTSFAPPAISLSTTRRAVFSTAVPEATLNEDAAQSKLQERRKLIRQEGGLFAFNTKYGGLNPFAIYYGLVSIFLGIPWFITLTLYQLFRVITFNKIDKQRVFPIFVTHIWGTTLMLLTRCFPKVEGHDVLMKFYKE